MPKITYIIDDKKIVQELTNKSLHCSHKIVKRKIDGVNYRFCEKCGMKAHADEKYHYLCGFEYCRCMQ